MAKDEKDKVQVSGETKPQEPDPTIEELAAKKKLPAWALEGMKRAYRWGDGKRVPEGEFDRLTHEFLKGPMAR